MIEENDVMQACDKAKEDPYWEAKRNAALASRIRKRTNCECLVELTEELFGLDRRYKKLAAAIDENPAHVSESAKALWPAQYKAMGDYKKALQARIINLIETDKD